MPIAGTDGSLGEPHTSSPLRWWSWGGQSEAAAGTWGSFLRRQRPLHTAGPGLQPAWPAPGPGALKNCPSKHFKKTARTRAKHWLNSLSQKQLRIANVRLYSEGFLSKILIIISL
eukprot:scaffold60382_cov30-Prasinocladus_malaysianus.AAC.1